MPITVVANPVLGLRVVSFDGEVDASAITELVSLYIARPEWLGHDSIYLLNAHVPGIDFGLLDELRRRLLEFYKRTEFIVLRRSAWICANPSARAFAEYWLRGRNSLDGSSAELCLGSELEDARCLFSAADLAAVRSGVGFVKLAQIGP